MTDVAAVAADLGQVEPRPSVPKPDPILRADGVQRRFGGLMAVNVQHLEVERGAITALIGPNGAGKTTLFNLLTGFDEADGGRWELDGEDVSNRRSYEIARAGMVRTFQLTRALARLSVRENLALGATDQRGERLRDALVTPRWREEEEAVQARAGEVLERFNLAHMAEEYAGTLSGGQRKLLEMARALMAAPRLVLLDEPMAGVNPALRQRLLEHVRDLRDEGMTVLYVEHEMDVVMDVSEWVVCMAAGEVIAEGPPAAIVTNDAVIDAYLGRRRGEG